MTLEQARAAGTGTLVFYRPRAPRPGCLPRDPEPGTIVRVNDSYVFVQYERGSAAATYPEDLEFQR